MTKALFKKQMMESFSWLYQDKRKGKNRSAAGVVLFAFLYLLLFGLVGFIFFAMADMLCAPLAEAGMSWLYFALMGLIAVALGVFGSVFNTYASLYRAKDNDLLLSLPIPTSHILTARLSGVYAMGLLYELIVMIPTLIVYFLNGNVPLPGMIFALLIPFVLSFFILTLSCILGWVVALVSSRLKSKNIITVILSLAFIAAYYYFYSQAYSMLQGILADPAALGSTVQGVLFPFYHMGLAAEGNALSMLIFTGIMAALFAVVYAILSRSFLKLATANRGAAKTVYREKTVKAASADRALLHKELRRFLGSSAYMLNCALGIVLMVIAAAFLLIKQDMVRELLFGMFAGYEELIPLIAVAAVCTMTTMNDITAPSISLEGNTLWLAQALPVKPIQVLHAKLNLHLLLTLIPAAILVAALELVLRPALTFALLIPAVTILFVLLMALLGLFFNLKFPNLTWTNETVPIKQGLPVTLALFGGWLIVLALVGLYFLLSRFASPLVYFFCVFTLLLAVDVLLLLWLKKRGAAIFAAL